MTGNEKVPAGLARQILRLRAQIETLRRTAAAPDDELLLTSPRVSAWAVAQQLEHLAATGDALLDAVEAILAAPAEPPTGTPTLAGRTVLLSGRIPRGRVQTRPQWAPETASPEAARRRLIAFAERFAGVAARAPELAAARATRPHPVLGRFTARQWLRFLEVHQSHHLKLVRDIRRAAGAGEEG